MNGRSNKNARVYRSYHSNGMHHRVSSAVTAERERTCSPIPIEYPVQPLGDLSAAMLDRHSDFRYQRELNTWQSRYNFLQKHYDTQKERLA